MEIRFQKHSLTAPISQAVSGKSPLRWYCFLQRFPRVWAELSSRTRRGTRSLPPLHHEVLTGSKASREVRLVRFEKGSDSCHSGDSSFSWVWVLCRYSFRRLDYYKVAWLLQGFLYEEYLSKLTWSWQIRRMDARWWVALNLSLVDLKQVKFCNPPWVTFRISRLSIKPRSFDVFKCVFNFLKWIRKWRGYIQEN